MMKRQHLLWIKIIGVVILITFCLLRWFFFDLVKQRMDGIFLLLIAFVFLLLLVPWERFPWERLSSFKAAGIVEVSLDKPEVKAALIDLGLIDNEELKKKLASMSSEIEQANGGRVLWIDDNPLQLYTERRFLRALGIQTTTAASSKEAEEILSKDNDFDLIITDARRADDDYAGANFIVSLRKADDPIIRSLPVIFYGIRWKWESLLIVTKPAREVPLEAQLSSTSQMLIVKTLQTLAQTRSQPLMSKSLKGSAVGPP